VGLRVQQGNEQVFFTPKHYFFCAKVLGKKVSSLLEWQCCKMPVLANACLQVGPVMGKVER